MVDGNAFDRVAQRVRQRPLVWGGVVALFVFPVILLGTLSLFPLNDEWPNLLVALAFTLPLVFLFTRPELTVALSVPALIAQIFLGRFTESSDLTYGNVVPLMGLCVIAARRNEKQTGWWAGATVLAFTAHTWLRWNSSPDRPARTVADWILDPIPVLFISAVPVLSAVLLGVVFKMQRERAAMLAVQAAQQERSRIAADLHDVLAHSLAVIAVQTDAAAHVLKQSPTTPPAARDAITAAHDAAVQALRDTRALVRTVDTEDAASEDHAPQPTLAQLPDLVRACDPTGSRFKLAGDVEQANAALSPSAQVALYRIVQEALTNVMRHAGDEAQAQVNVEVAEEAGRVRVEVVDNGDAPHSANPRGHGIFNMTQRAHSAGGELVAGPRPEGGFAVVAHVPFQEVGP